MMINELIFFTYAQILNNIIEQTLYVSLHWHTLELISAVVPSAKAILVKYGMVLRDLN